MDWVEFAWTCSCHVGLPIDANARLGYSMQDGFTPAPIQLVSDQASHITAHRVQSILSSSQTLS